MASNKLQIKEIVDRALAEDLIKGDVTTDALVPADQQGTGLIVLSPLSVALFGAVLLAVDYLIISRVGPRFEREQIICNL